MNMTKNTRIYLIVSLVLVPLGGIALLTHQAAAYPVLYVPLPVGAVLFGLFLVSSFLGRESEQFAKEQADQERAAERHIRKG
jgi:hypothetical protein